MQKTDKNKTDGKENERKIKQEDINSKSGKRRPEISGRNSMILISFLVF